MTTPATSRAMSPEIPRIPHLARRRTEVGDLRDDVDDAFLRLEGEIDAITAPGTPATNITGIHTAAVVNVALNDTAMFDPTLNPQTAQLPAADAPSVGRLLEVKAVIGATPGAALPNDITVTPAGVDTIEGQPTFVISVARGSVILRSDGAGSWLLVGAYLPSVVSAGAGDHHQTDFFVATPLQTVFILSQTPADPADVQMHVNGALQRFGADFTVVGTTVTWLDVQFTLSGGDVVQLDYDF